MEERELYFCKICRNNITLQDKRAIEEDEDKKDSAKVEPVLICTACNTIEEIKAGHSVFKRVYYKAEGDYKIDKNLSYYKDNPTCMRMIGVNCPNDDCKTNDKGGPPCEVSLFYDINKEKSVFICQECGHTWIL